MDNIPSGIFFIVGAAVTGAIVFAGLIVAAVMIGSMIAPAA
jgi:hypothetical protein